MDNDNTIHHPGRIVRGAIKEWKVSGVVIVPNNYLVKLETSQGEVYLYEKFVSLYVTPNLWLIQNISR